MATTPRFQLRLPPEQREQVEELARELGTTTSELTRLGLTWVVANRDLLLRGGRPPAELTGVAA